MGHSLNSGFRLILSFFFGEKTELRLLKRICAENFDERAERAHFEISLPLPVYPLYSYKDPLVRLAILTLKNQGDSKIVNLFAHLLNNNLDQELEDEILFTDFKEPLFIPIPSHFKKIKLKGFNQTEIILKELQKISSYYFLNALEKTKETFPQVGLNRRKRLINLKGCFNIRSEFKEKIKNKNVIIFDDVITTGATLIEAWRVLKKAKPRRIIAVTLAH